MTETTTRKDHDDANRGEIRVQTIMIGLTTLLIGWSFKTSVDMGNDLAAIKVKLQTLEAERAEQQPVLTRLASDAAQLRLELSNTTFRVDYLETKLLRNATTH